MSKNINPMLLCDFYKTVHSDMINPKMTKSMSYYTPRMSRVNRWDKVVMFGVQMFCKTWLIDYFNENFFELSEDEVHLLHLYRKSRTMPPKLRTALRETLENTINLYIKSAGELRNKNKKQPK